MPLHPDWPDKIHSIAVGGFYIALRVGFAFPLEERNELPAEWVRHYTENAMMLYDPIMKWVYANDGAARWTAISLPDPRDVFGAAAGFGLKYGVAISHSCSGSSGQRSFGTFARADREFLDDEISELQGILIKLHEQSRPPVLTKAETEALTMVKDGLRLKEIAYRLGVSESAIKLRLSGAKRKLGAKTNTQAASMATEFRLLQP